MSKFWAKGKGKTLVVPIGDDALRSIRDSKGSEYTALERLLCDDLLRERERCRKFKEAFYVNAYSNDDALGSFRLAARADVIVRLLIGSKHVDHPYVYWVEVVKNRGGDLSRHAFLTMEGALKFVRREYS